MSNQTKHMTNWHTPSASRPHIFITGRAGHGKDSIGDHLIAKYGFERLSFSDGIRKEIAVAYANSILPVTVQWQDTREIKEIPQDRLALVHCNDDDFVAICLKEFAKEDAALCMENGVDELTNLERMRLARSPRRIQQIWGTEYRRAQDELYWLKYAEEKTNFTRPKVLTSVRYANELEFGSRIDAVRVHVERPGVAAAAHHVTEELLPLDERTIVIRNEGSLADLHKKVDAVMAGLSASASARLLKHPRP